jgi:hypothetical protein
VALPALRYVRYTKGRETAEWIGKRRSIKSTPEAVGSPDRTPISDAGFIHYQTMVASKNVP